MVIVVAENDVLTMLGRGATMRALGRSIRAGAGLVRNIRVMMVPMRFLRMAESLSFGPVFQTESKVG